MASFVVLKNDEMIFHSLQNIPISALAATFNHAFSDYLVPFHLSEAQLENKLLSDGVRLELSAGAFEGDHLIGFILHGFDVVDGRRILYNAGTGVIPEKRGQKITARLFEFILPVLRAEHIKSVQLEVIHGNQPAIKTYQSIGFKVVRQLDCFKGAVEIKNISNVDIRELGTYNWPLMRTFWDWQPSWQNSVTALENVRNTNISIGAFDGENLIGYLLYNPVSNRIQQFAVDSRQRGRGVGRQLFEHIARLANKDLVLINVDHNATETAAFLLSLGLKPYVSQYEMVMEL